jgi:hypothetical protein
MYTNKLFKYIFCIMPSSGILCRMSLVITDVSKEGSASIITVTIIDEIETSASTSNRRTRRASVASYCQYFSYLTDSYQPDDGSTTFHKAFGSYKSHTT